MSPTFNNLCSTHFSVLLKSSSFYLNSTGKKAYFDPLKWLHFLPLISLMIAVFKVLFFLNLATNPCCCSSHLLAFLNAFVLPEYLCLTYHLLFTVVPTLTRPKHPQKSPKMCKTSAKHPRSVSSQTQSSLYPQSPVGKIAVCYPVGPNSKTHRPH